MPMAKKTNPKKLILELLLYIAILIISGAFVIKNNLALINNNTLYNMIAVISAGLITIILLMLIIQTIIQIIPYRQTIDSFKINNKRTRLHLYIYDSNIIFNYGLDKQNIKNEHLRINNKKLVIDSLIKSIYTSINSHDAPIKNKDEGEISMSHKNEPDTKLRFSIGIINSNNTSVIVIIDEVNSNDPKK